MTVKVASFQEPVRFADEPRRAVVELGRLARQALDLLWVWQSRAEQRYRLATLDARMLADMGLSRADALGEADKPFWRP